VIQTEDLPVGAVVSVWKVLSVPVNLHTCTFYAAHLHNAPAIRCYKSVMRVLVYRTQMTPSDVKKVKLLVFL